MNSDLLLEAIFTKCGLVYGRDFLSRWEGLNLEEVKADWKRELGHLLNVPQAIRYGLENLPNKPPHVLEFRALCVAHRPEPLRRIEQPVTDEQKAANAEIKRKAVAALKLMGSRRPRVEGEAA